MTDDIARERLARIVWETSRHDEGTISVTGANIIADAILAAGFGDVGAAKAEGMKEAAQIAMTGGARKAAVTIWDAAAQYGTPSANGRTFAALVMRQSLIDPNERFLSRTYSAECAACGWQGEQRWQANAEELAVGERDAHECARLL